MKRMNTLIVCFFTICTMVSFDCSCDKNPSNPDDPGGNSGDSSNTITDTRDGQTYRIVTIGSQTWMQENLNVGIVTTNRHQVDNDTIEKFAYDGDPAYCDTFGGLYQWHEAMEYDSTEGLRGICPEGWHIPTSAEWDTLVYFLGGYGAAGSTLVKDGPDDFNMLMGGHRQFTGMYVGKTKHATFWSSTNDTSVDGWMFYVAVNNGLSDVYRMDDYPTNGYSVRCVRD